MARRRLELAQEEVQKNPQDKDLLQKEHECIIAYTSILSSSLSLIKQQSRALWMNQGDRCIKAFMVKMKQKRLQAYVYAIKDKDGEWQEGFENVSQVMNEFYRNLLGTQVVGREPIDIEVMQEGRVLDVE